MTQITGNRPLEPFYPLGAVDEPILLHSGDLLATQGKQTIRVSGTIHWEWLPTPRIAYRFSTSDPDLYKWDLFASDYDIQLPDDSAIKSNDASSPDTEAAALHMDGRMSNITLGTKVDIRRVVFHVANMPSLHGAHLQNGQSWWNGHLEFTTQTWKFILDEREDRDVIRGDLRARGGYAATHVGELTRIDGAELSEEEISNAFHMLRCCLSFAFGRHITPFLAVGFDSSGAVTWQDWRVFALSSWTGGSHVIDATGRLDMAELISGFGRLWSDQFTRDLLSYATHYYLECSDPQPLNLAVSAGQAGLELLAYERLVEELKQLTAKEYKNSQVNPAHKNLAELISSYGIDTSLPQALTNLCAAASRVQPACTTGPEILTRMRNGVIHPSRSKPKFSSAEWTEAWLLTQHYLLLTILGRINFKGSFRDPLDPDKNSGKVTRVPWA